MLSRQLALRVASGSAAASVSLAAILVGPPLLTFLALAGGFLAIVEAYGLTPAGVARMPVAIGVLAVAAILLSAEVAAGPSDYLLASAVVLCLWTLLATWWFVAYYDGERAFAGFLLLLLAPVYAGFLLGHGLAMYSLGPEGAGLANTGRIWLFLTLVATTASDTGAYVIGRLVGRHPMAPKLSPGKTWEGAVGGFVLAISTVLAMAQFLEVAIHLWQVGIVAVAAALAAQAGDLFESFLKRRADVKDSGSIMPGHGGILDRIDSILFALPAVYYLLTMVFGL